MFGVIGCGVVGRAIIHGLTVNKHKWWGYDVEQPETISCNVTKKPSKTILSKTSAVFLAVPTQPSETAKGYLLKPLLSALDLLIDYEYQGVVVVVSTIGPADADLLVAYGNENKATYTFLVCPEFLTAKNAFKDFYCPEGSMVYYGPSIPVKARPFVEDILCAPRHPSVTYKNMSTAECCLIKTWRNIALAQKLLTANMIYFSARNRNIEANRAQAVVDEVFNDNRLRTPTPYVKVGNDDGGLGFAGACLPKDLAAMIWSMPNNAIRSYLEAAQHLNNMLRNLTDKPSYQAESYPKPKGQE